MSTSHWRNKSRRVITEALKEGRANGLEGKALEKFVSEAYPFGERAMHPYKIWLSEFSILVRGVRKVNGKPVASSVKLLGEWPMTDEQKKAMGM